MGDTARRSEVPPRKILSSIFSEGPAIGLTFAKALVGKEFAVSMSSHPRPRAVRIMAKYL